jgi:hypothetical protein
MQQQPRQPHHTPARTHVQEVVTVSDVRHVVLAKPGDLLLIGNAGTVPVEQLRKLQEFFQHLKIEALCFTADIDLQHAARVLQERHRAQLGLDDCGCGGCDSCAQQALVNSPAQQQPRQGVEGA